MEQSTTPTASRRDAFLTIALGVAKHNLPTPELVSVYAEHPSANLDLDADDLDGARQWADYLGIKPDRTAPRAGGGVIHVWYGERDGWWWHVRTTTPDEVADTALGLADRVVEAIGDTLKAGAR